MSKPVNVLAVPSFTVKALAEAGVRRISLGSKLTTFAFGMIENASREMLRDGTFGFTRAGMAFDRVQAMFSKSGRLEQFQEKWEPVFRPELRQNMS